MMIDWWWSWSTVYIRFRTPLKMILSLPRMWSKRSVLFLQIISSYHTKQNIDLRILRSCSFGWKLETILHKPFFNIINVIQILVLKYTYIQWVALEPREGQPMNQSDHLSIYLYLCKSPSSFKKRKISFKCENIQTCFSLNMKLISIHIQSWKFGVNC